MGPCRWTSRVFLWRRRPLGSMVPRPRQKPGCAVYGDRPIRVGRESAERNRKGGPERDAQVIDPEASPPPSPEPPPAGDGGRGLDLSDDRWIPENRPAIRSAWETLRRRGVEEREERSVRGRIPAGLFENIQGHDEVKRVLRLALDSQKPIHVLLVGPPGTAKTEFLLDMKRLWGSHYATGAAISQAGIVQFLIQRPTATRLLIDDLDKADDPDLWALLELMQSGSVTRMQHDRQEHVERKGIRVFAAANSAYKIPESLLR